MEDKELEDVFLTIYEETYDSCLRYLTLKCGNLSDLSDLMQDTYLEVYDTLKKKGRSYIKVPEAFVISVAKRKLSRHYTWVTMLRQRFQNSDEDDIEKEYEKPESLESSVENHIFRKEQLTEVWNYLKLKPLPVQKAFYLYYEQEVSIREITELLGKKESTIKNWIYRTVNEIRSLGREE